MYKVLALTLFIMSISCVAQAQDPLKVDSQHYKIEFENDEVRVLRVKVNPNEKSVMHQHPNAVAIFMTDVNVKFSFPTGEPQNVTTKAGQVLWTPAVTHMPENTGDQPFEVILVELKKPAKKTHHAANPKRR